jgi:hypothetical protein
MKKMDIVLNQFSEIVTNEKEKAVVENKVKSMEIDDEDDILMSKNGNNNNISTKRKHNETEDSLEETISSSKDYVKYFPKYLTSYALFDKEVRIFSLKRKLIKFIAI